MTATGDVAGVLSPARSTDTPAVEPVRRAGSRWLTASRFIIALLALFTVKQIFLVAAFYPFSGHDELAHYSYVRTLVSDGRLPVLPDLEAWRGALADGEPPPTDEIPAELYDYCRFTLDWYCEPESPRWRNEPPRIVTVPGLGYFPSGYQYVANHPPLYYAAMAPLFKLSSALPPVPQHYLLRLAAIPFGLVTIYAAYRMARALVPGDAFLAVTVPTVVAFQPQISYEAAMVNNDIVAIAVTALLLWGIVVGIRDRFPLKLCAVLGIGLGIGLLTKSTTMTIAPIMAAAVILALGWRDWRGVVARGLAMIVPAALLAGPWYLYLYRNYGDLSGLARVEALQYWNAPMGSFWELLTDPNFVLGRFRETWGEYGWRLIHLSTPLLWAIAIPTLIGVLGLVVYALKIVRVGAFDASAERRPDRWQIVALVVLALACVVAYLAVIQFGTGFALAQARYFFPVVNAGVLLLMVGWRTLIPHTLRPAGQGVVVAALLTLNLVIMVSYVLPFTVAFEEPVMPWVWGG